MQTCMIEQVGKARNGKPRFWCRTHGANATGRYGAKLSTCERAEEEDTSGDHLELDADAYSGGVALWGAVAPVYDTSGRPHEAGIHVHARRRSGNEKEIDGTFSRVSLIYRRDLFDERLLHITADAAVQYYISRFIGKKIKSLFCPDCGTPHLDVDYFAVAPHRRHLCNGCGKYFHDSEQGISNPIMLLRQQLGDSDEERTFKCPDRSLDVKQAEYPGGLQIWASNPAIVWTAERPEEEGIHIHLYANKDAEPVADDTFGKVRIDGVDLDDELVRHLMAQRALRYLRDKVVSLRCPRCGGAHFDREEFAFRPHKHHTCEECGSDFEAPGRRRLVVSNPLVDILDRLRARANQEPE